MSYVIVAFILSFLGGVAGVLGGMTGTGGIIIPPIMIEFLGYNPHMAMAMAQASYIFPCCLAVYLFSRKGQYEPFVALSMAVPGLIVAFLAAKYIKPIIDPILLNIIFSLCIIISGAVMLKSKPLILKKRLPRMTLMATLGILGGLVGIMAGITGSGTNAVLVPLMFFFGLDILTVLGTCQLYAGLSSMTGTIGNIMNMDMNYLGVFYLTASQMIGILLGVRMAQKAEIKKLKRTVGVVCLLAGLSILAKNLYLLIV